MNYHDEPSLHARLASLRPETLSQFPNSVIEDVALLAARAERLAEVLAGFEANSDWLIRAMGDWDEGGAEGISCLHQIAGDASAALAAYQATE